jgi:hypothetical protein
MEEALARNTEYARFFYEGLAEPLLGESPRREGLEPLRDEVVEVISLSRRQGSCAGKFFEQLDCFSVARDLFNYFRLLVRHQRRRFISAGKCAAGFLSSCCYDIEKCPL